MKGLVELMLNMIRLAAEISQRLIAAAAIGEIGAENSAQNALAMVQSVIDRHIEMIVKRRLGDRIPAHSLDNSDPVLIKRLAVLIIREKRIRNLTVHFFTDADSGQPGPVVAAEELGPVKRSVVLRMTFKNAAGVELNGHAIGIRKMEYGGDEIQRPGGLEVAHAVAVEQVARITVCAAVHVVHQRGQLPAMAEDGGKFFCRIT
ncbi:MAG: hypothetical protein BWY83_01083 [bacterium ADurb.Bin478]|nr:MAG: hypothetical protein BWY83_01083 [bacterium ADurb.Bin478]